MTAQLIAAPRISGLPELFTDRTLGGYDPSLSPSQRSAHEAALEYIEHHRQNLILIGRPGAGKSHLAAGIANAIWSEEWGKYRERVEIAEAAPERVPWPTTPYQPRWVNVPDLISRLRGFDDETRWEARDIGKYPGVVVLDDLGREKSSDWTAAEVYVLVNARYEAKRRTIVTSNLTPAELGEAGYGPSVSRLAEGGRLIQMSSAVDYRTRRVAP